MLFALATIPLIVASKHFLFWKLLETSVKRHNLFASSVTCIIVKITIKRQSFYLELCLFVYHHFETKRSFKFKFFIQISQFYLTTSFLQVVSILVIIGTNFANVISLVVPSFTKFTLSLSLTISSLQSYVRRVIFYLKVNVLIDPLFECVIIFFGRWLITFEYIFYVIVDLFLHFDGRVLHVEV